MARRYPELADRDWLEREYVQKARSMGDIAGRLGCVRQAVSYAMSRHGIPTYGRDRQNRTVVYPQLADRGWLTREYDAGRSMSDIASEVGCSAATVRFWLQTHGIEVHRNWRRDDVTYSGAIIRVRRARGSASRYLCELCGERPARAWRLIDDGIDVRGMYSPPHGCQLYCSLDVDDYAPMCARCRPPHTNARM